jgi:CzcA family heavy metal efflux pump
MFRWIIGSSLKFRFVVLGIAAALIALGIYRLQKMPVDVFPEFAAPSVEVQTEAIGLSAAEVERLVTLNIEELLSGVPWLKSIRSTSVTGLSSIVLTFERGTDIWRARQMIQERLTLAYTLPNVAQPPVILNPVSATGRFMMIAISSKTVEPTELSLIARWTIKPKLLGVPGVANVAIWGQRLRQLHVQFDPQRLRDARVSQDDIIAAAGDALWVTPLTFLRGSFPGTGGWIDNRNQRLGVHHSMPIKTPEDMAKVPLAAQHLVMTGKNLSLGEIAETTFDHPPLIGDAFVNNGNGLLIVIDKLPSANTLEVTRGVERALAELKHGLPGVEIDPGAFRLASYIEDSISNLSQALLLGAVLVVLMVGALLFNWRAALIAAASIPLALLAAVLALQLAGATLNTMILAGLVVALGVVIDDAVLDVDRLMQRLRSRAQGDGASIARLIYETTLETRGVALYAALIVILAVTPIFFFGGVAGAFFEPLALAYVLAAAASMLVALTVTPALSVLLLRNANESPAARWLGRSFDAALLRAIDAPRTVAIGAALFVVGGLAAAPFLGQSLLPFFKERDVVVSLNTAPGTSWPETYRITSRVSRELQSLPGVRKVAAHVGRAVTGDQVVEINSSQIWVSLDRRADYENTLAAIRDTVEGYPGVERNVQSYLRDRIGEVLTGAGNVVVVRIYGQSREILKQKAAEVSEALSGIRGIVDLRAEGQAEEPQVYLKVKLDSSAPASVKPGDVRRTTANVFGGLTVGFLYEEQKIWDVVVWGAPETRRSLTDLRDLWIEKPDRTHVRLGDVTEVSIVPTPRLLRHESIAPYVDVVANVAGRELGAVAEEIDRRLRTIEFPLEYHARLLGEYAERLAVHERVAGVALAVVIGIFLLLQARFRSWRLALIAFLALPASIAGGVIAALIGGGVVSLGSMVGFLAVLGIAARNGLLLIDRYQRLEGEEGVPFGRDLVLRGVRERLAPIMASFAAIVAALLPLVVFGRVAGLEIAQPTAIVIIGGLVASTLVTLFVMPVLYLVIGARAQRQFDLGLERE